MCKDQAINGYKVPFQPVISSLPAALYLILFSSIGQKKVKILENNQNIVLLGVAWGRLCETVFQCSSRKEIKKI